MRNISLTLGAISNILPLFFQVSLFGTIKMVAWERLDDIGLFDKAVLGSRVLRFNIAAI